MSDVVDATQPVGEAAAGRRPRRWRWLAAGLCVVAVAAGWWCAGQLSSLASGPTFDVVDTGELQFVAGDESVTGAMHQVLSGHSGDALALNPRHQPLDHEPAGVEPPDLPGLDRGGRYQLADGPWVDEVSYWRLPADTGGAAALLAHYRGEAARLGFRELSDRSSTDSHDLLAFVSGHDPPRLLTVAVRPAGSKLHVTLWSRYAVSPR